MTDAEIKEKYLELLHEFNTYSLYDNLLETKSYVSMDNIHEAIITVGLFMDKPIKYYIIKAKQNAIDEYCRNNRQYRIVMENISKVLTREFDYTFIFEYNFTSEELDIIVEIIKGVPIYKSGTPRRKRKALLDGIKDKIRKST